MTQVENEKKEIMNYEPHSSKKFDPLNSKFDHETNEIHKFEMLKRNLELFLKSNKKISTKSIKFIDFSNEFKTILFQNHKYFYSILLILLENENSEPFISFLKQENEYWFNISIEYLFTNKINNFENINSNQLENQFLVHNEIRNNTQIFTNEHFQILDQLNINSMIYWNAIHVYHLGDIRQRFQLLERKFEDRTPTKLLIKLVDGLIHDFVEFAKLDKYKQENMIKDCFIYENNNFTSQDDSTQFISNIKLNRYCILNYMKFIFEAQFIWSKYLKRAFMYRFALKLLNKRFKDAFDLISQYKTNFEERIKLSTEIIIHLWKTYGSFLIEGETSLHQYTKSNLVDFLKSLLQEIQIAENQRIISSSGEDSFNGLIFYCAICFTLTFSKQSSKKKQEIIQILSSTIFQSVSLAIQNPKLDRDTMYLCIYILREGILSSEVIKSKFKEIVVTIQNELSEKGSNDTSICILAEYFKLFPEEIPGLFSRLEKSNIEKINVLKILEEIMNIKQDSLADDIVDNITNEVIKRLNDDDLFVRLGATNIVCHLNLNILLPQLMNQITNKDEKYRSSIIHSLKSLFSNLENSIILKDVLQYSIQNFKTEQEIGIVSSVLSLALDEFNQQLISTSHYVLMLQTTHELFLMNPSNSIALTVMKKIHNNKKISQCVDKVFNDMANKLNFSFFENKDIHQDEKIYISNLAPLLVLVSIPVIEFLTSRYPILSEALKQGIYSMDQKVRQLSGDLLSRFLPEAYHEQYMKEVNTYLEMKQFNRIKTFMFVIFQTLQIHESISNIYVKDYFHLIESIFSQIDLDNDELINCQRGAINSMSMMIRNEMREYKTNETTVQNSSLNYLLNNLTDKNVSSSTKICIVNVFSTFTMGIAGIYELNLLLNRSISKLHQIIQDESQDIIIRLSLLHFLLVTTNQLKSGIYPFSTEFVSLIKYCLYNSDSQIRKSGLKLFSGVIVAKEDIILEFESDFQDILKKIKSISLIEEDAETRALAEKFSNLLHL